MLTALRRVIKYSFSSWYVYKNMSSSKISNMCLIERRNASTGNTAACINIQYKGIHWIHVLHKFLQFTIYTRPVTKKKNLTPYPDTPTQPHSHYTVLSPQFPRRHTAKTTKHGRQQVYQYAHLNYTENVHGLLHHVLLSIIFPDTFS